MVAAFDCEIDTDELETFSFQPSSFSVCTIVSYGAGTTSQGEGRNGLFVGNNPINGTDPTGQFFIGAVVDGVIGAGSAYLGAIAQGGSVGDALGKAVIGGVAGAIIGALDPSEGLLSSAAIGGLTGLITNEAGQLLEAHEKPGGLTNFNMDYGSYASSGGLGALSGVGEIALAEQLTMRTALSLEAAKIAAKTTYALGVETAGDVGYDTYKKLHEQEEERKKEREKVKKENSGCHQ